MEAVENVQKQISDAELLGWLGIGSPACIARRRMNSFQHLMEYVCVNAQGVTHEFFVRVYLGDFSWWTQTADIAEREEVAYALARSIGINVPEVIRRGRFGDFEYVISKKVQGEDFVRTCNRRSVHELARVVHQLHSAEIPAPARKLPDVSLHKFFPLMRSWCRQIRAHDLLEILDPLELKLRDVAHRGPVILHGDCHQGNFLTGPGTGLTMLDLEEACLGDPRIDLASMAYQLAHMVSKEAAHDFLTEYQRQIDWNIGDVKIWKELLEFRDVVTARWMEHQIAKGKTFPYLDAKLWIQRGQALHKRLRHQPFVSTTHKDRGDAEQPQT